MTTDPEAAPTRTWLARNAWWVLVLACFSAVYLSSLTFVYVEGDDAYSMSFHALGRDVSVQPPYSPYQAMMDRILEVLLPPDEPTLRIVGICISAVAAAALAVLLLLLCFTWLPPESTAPRPILALVLLLACPELLYFGLLYLPSTLSMSLAIGAHLLARVTVEKGRVRGGYVAGAASLILYGLAVPIRWEIGVYGLVIVADLAFGAGLQGDRRTRLRRAFIWGALAVTSGLSFIGLSGHSPLEALAESSRMGTVPSSAVRFTVARLQSCFTPALVLLALSGLLLWKGMRIIALLGLLLVLPWLTRFGMPKSALPALPGIAAAALIAFSRAWELRRGERVSVALRGLLAGLLLAPWMIGVQVRHPSYSYGPGFQLRCFDRPAGEAAPSMSLVLGPGTCLPTPEGPRPLWGHASILLGGGWRDLVLELDQERKRVLATARERSLPILHDMGVSYLTAHLLELGFSTRDTPWTRRSPLLYQRRFQAVAGAERLTLLRLVSRARLLEGEGVRSIRETAGQTVVLFAYTKTIRRIHAVAPSALKKMGPQSAILDLDQLGEELKRP